MRIVLVAALLCVAFGLGLPPGSGAQVIRAGPPTCRGVALTFDLCPVREGPGYDAALVDLLISRRIPATFFVSGRWAQRHDQQLRTLLTVPYFEVGTHGQAHAHLPLLNADRQRDEIQQAVSLLVTRYGYAPTLFRPPYGEFDATTVELTRSLGLRFVLWSIVSGDPDPHLSAEEMLATVRPKVRNGSILVFHANGKGRHTRKVVERLFEVLAKDGLPPVTVSDLVDRCKGDSGR